MKYKLPRRTRFGKLKIGDNFLWGTKDPKFRKVDDGVAVRMYPQYIGRSYAFADKCLVTKGA